LPHLRGAATSWSHCPRRARHAVARTAPGDSRGPAGRATSRRRASPRCRAARIRSAPDTLRSPRAPPRCRTTCSPARQLPARHSADALPRAGPATRRARATRDRRPKTPRAPAAGLRRGAETAASGRAPLAAVRIIWGAPNWTNRARTAPCGRALEALGDEALRELRGAAGSRRAPAGQRWPCACCCEPCGTRIPAPVGSDG